MTKISWSGAWLPVIHRVPVLAGKRRVALSIDDGPSEATAAILTALAETDATATFFLSGQRVQARPDIVEAIVQAGHSVYGHGIEHVRLDREPVARIVADLQASEDLLARFRPTPDPYLVRLPYAAGRREQRIHRAIRQWRANAQLAHWSHSTDDYEIAPKCASRDEAESLCRSVVEKVLSADDLDGAILLMHDAPFDVPSTLTMDVTRLLADILIRELARTGYAVTGIEPLTSSPLPARFILEK